MAHIRNRKQQLEFSRCHSHAVRLKSFEWRLNKRQHTQCKSPIISLINIHNNCSRCTRSIISVIHGLYFHVEKEKSDKRDELFANTGQYCLQCRSTATTIIFTYLSVSMFSVFHFCHSFMVANYCCQRAITMCVPVLCSHILYCVYEHEQH